MDEFSTRTYGTSGPDNRPLFGETSARDRIINMVMGGFTSVVVLVSLSLLGVDPLSSQFDLNLFNPYWILLQAASYGQSPPDPFFLRLNAEAAIFKSNQWF
ncbi:hypothetical protein AMECASPLE_005842 [Ameca splendens]|uniref:Uncharacterized protein n=1 Tax=Ameca splendens TaxID=208324 RepID=A0ABV0ZV51_9TELE